jgi:hypothetical protein
MPHRDDAHTRRCRQGKSPYIEITTMSLWRKRLLLARLFGADEGGFPDLPKKIGSVAIVRSASRAVRSLFSAWDGNEQQQASEEPSTLKAP